MPPAGVEAGLDNGVEEFSFLATGLHIILTKHAKKLFCEEMLRSGLCFGRTKWNGEFYHFFTGTRGDPSLSEIILGMRWHGITNPNPKLL